MVQPTSVHHVAVMATDMKKHIDFFTQVMGCPLVALFDMHGVPGALHGFMKLNDSCYFSVVQMPAVADAPIEIGRTHAGSGSGACAAGTMQHLAFNVDKVEDLVRMRDQIRSHGINVIGPFDHGFCQSIYFAGPDRLTLEVSTTVGSIDPRAWIDPKSLETVGISAEELERYKAPKGYSGPSPVPQPAYDPEKPHQDFPLKSYLKMLELPDEVLNARSSFAEPPVKIAS